MQILRLLFVSAATVTLGACAHVAPVSDEAPKAEKVDAEDKTKGKQKKIYLTGSRIATNGSPQSRGVRVIQAQRIRETGEVVDLSRALQQISPIIQIQPGNINR